MIRPLTCKQSNFIQHKRLRVTPIKPQPADAINKIIIIIIIIFNPETF